MSTKHCSQTLFQTLNNDQNSSIQDSLKYFRKYLKELDLTDDTEEIGEFETKLEFVLDFDKMTPGEIIEKYFKSSKLALNDTNLRKKLATATENLDQEIVEAQKQVKQVKQD